MSDEPVGGPNPKRFREMQEPHESSEVMAKSFDEFFKVVEAARLKFRVAEVEIVAVMKALTDGGQEGEAMLRMHLGDPLRAESMAAFAYGTLKREREEMIATLLSGQGRSQKKAR